MTARATAAYPSVNIFIKPLVETQLAPETHQVAQALGLTGRRVRPTPLLLPPRRLAPRLGVLLGLPSLLPFGLATWFGLATGVGWCLIGPRTRTCGHSCQIRPFVEQLMFFKGLSTTGTIPYSPKLRRPTMRLFVFVYCSFLPNHQAVLRRMKTRPKTRSTFFDRSFGRRRRCHPQSAVGPQGWRKGQRRWRVQPRNTTTDPPGDQPKIDPDATLDTLIWRAQRVKHGSKVDPGFGLDERSK